MTPAEIEVAVAFARIAECRDRAIALLDRLLASEEG